MDIEPERGAADTGDLEFDLPILFAAVAEAVEESGAAVAILIDEIQYLNSSELSALIMAMHKIQQRQLPLVLVATGLSQLPRLARILNEAQLPSTAGYKFDAHTGFIFPQLPLIDQIARE